MNKTNQEVFPHFAMFHNICLLRRRQLSPKNVYYIYTVFFWL